jgi:hypothetical protein
VGRGNLLYIGADPWPRSGISHILPLELINLLHGKNIFLLSHLADPNTTLWHRGWKRVVDLGLTGASITQYKNYIAALQVIHIRLLNGEDELVWQKDPLGDYTPNLGYITLILDLFQQHQIWWWKGLWKLKCPQKSKLFLWADLNGKVPTW